MTVDVLLCHVVAGRATAWPAWAGSEEERAFIELAERAMVWPLIAYRLEAAGRLAEWPAAMAARALEARREALLLEAIRWREDARVLTVLADAGISPLLLKGAALARRLYPAPYLRPRVDTDLLVRDEDLPRVGAVLSAAGYQEDVMAQGRLLFGERRWVRTVAPGVTYVLDLHWRLVNARPFAEAVPFGAIEESAVEVPGFPVRVRAPDDRYSLLGATVHYVVQHGARFDPLWLYDMHLLAARLGEAGLADTAVLARRHGVLGPYLRALREVARWFDTSVPELDAGSPDVTRALAVYTRPDTRLIDVVWRDLTALPTWRARCQLVREHLLPSSSYMLRRYGVRRRVWLPLLYLHRAATGWRGWLRPLVEQQAAQLRAAAKYLPGPAALSTAGGYTEGPMPPRLSLDHVVRIGKHVLYRELDGELVLLNLDSGVYFGLDRMGTRIWHLLAAHGSLRTVFETLVADYDAPPEQIERDLLGLVSTLTRKGLLASGSTSSRETQRRRGRLRS